MDAAAVSVAVAVLHWWCFAGSGTSPCHHSSLKTACNQCAWTNFERCLRIAIHYREVEAEFESEAAATFAAEIGVETGKRCWHPC